MLKIAALFHGTGKWIVRVTFENGEYDFFYFPTAYSAYYWAENLGLELEEVEG